jgi:preprotein translocase subunit SecF
LYAISANHTHSPGIPVINQPDIPEINNSINKNAVSNVNSENSNVAGNSKIATVVKDLINDIKKRKDMLWIVWILFSTFVVVITVMTLIKGKALKQYKNELIIGTDKEFKDATRVLSQKVPVIPEDIRSKLSQIVNQGFSDAKKQEAKQREAARIKESQNISKDIEDLKKSLEKNKK